MEYYRFDGGSEVEYVRLDRAAHRAWYFDDGHRDWVEQGAYYAEVVSNGGGVPVAEADVLDFIGQLQSA